MMYSKIEIIAQMDINNAEIIATKNLIKKAEKIMSLIEELNREACYEVTTNDALANFKMKQNEVIDKLNEYQKKRKKQLKLLEKMEELDGE